MNQVVDQLDVSPKGTRVGLVQYSSRVRTEFPLSMYQTKEEIKKAVLNVEYMEKGTMTGLALKHMVENSFSEAEGARANKNIPRVGLVFTDGRSQDDITEWAKKAKDAGVSFKRQNLSLSIAISFTFSFLLQKQEQFICSFSWKQSTLCFFTWL